MIRALVVEDEPISRDLLTKMLNPFARVDAVPDGKLGIEAFTKAWEQKDPYGLICLDIMMPLFNGHQVLSQIRKFERENQCAEEVPIMMTTALDDEENFVKAHKEGIQWYVTKPIDRSKLMEILQDLGLMPG